jgi:hypothetical protein
MNRVKEYLAPIPIVGSKYVYQRRGVNGSFKFSSKISKLSEPSSGTNENKVQRANTNYRMETKSMHRGKSHD